MYPHIIAEKLQTLAPDARSVVEIPKHPEHGDWATPIAMHLAKTEKQAPAEIARELANTWNAEFKAIAHASAHESGFVNFTIPNERLAALIVSPLSDVKSKNGTVLIEYSSPNVAKRMHVGHMRSTIVGAALANTYEACGYDVIRASHPGDWGTQFGMIIAEYVDIHGEHIEKLESMTVSDIESTYVERRKKDKENADSARMSRAWTKKLQSGDTFAISAWKKIIEISESSFKNVYDALRISFDIVRGESEYRDMLPNIVEQAIAHGAVEGEEHPDGGHPIILSLDEYGVETPMIVKKSDGGYVYHTTDLAAIAYRKETYPNLAGVRYVVGAEQKLHFKQLFAGARKMGLLSDAEAKNWKHVPLGMITGETGKKFSTRSGDAVVLDELLERAEQYAYDIVSEKNPDMNETKKREIANAIGLSGLIFTVLKQSRESSISFDWDRMLDVSGDGAGYVLYTRVRLLSLFKTYEYERTVDSISESVLESPHMRAIAILIHRLPFVLESACAEDAPNMLARWLLDVSDAVTGMYHAERLNDMVDAEREMYLHVLHAAYRSIDAVCGILHMQTVDEM